MVQDLSEETIKDQYELYNRLKNDTRKDLLTFLYEQPRNYKELAEYSGLKPGSLYHHLGVLEPLIEKYDHGQYQITDLGRQIMESLEMVSPNEKKPKITSTRSESTSEELDEGDLGQPEVTEVKDESGEMQRQEKAEEVLQSGEPTEKIGDTDSNNILYYIWLSPSGYILVFISLLVMVLLAFQGVAFAGSAIYAVGNSNAFLVDLFAIILGIGSLFILEDLLQKYPIYDRVKFVTIIRIISMLPSLIIGITLLLLFMTGIIVPAGIYPIIFVMGLVMGTIAMTYGIHYLRAQPLSDAILYSIVPSSIDLLIGVVILLSV